MRGSMHNQILIPLIGIQAPVVTAATLMTPTLAAGQSERERGLRNAIEHAAIVALGQPIRPEHLWLPWRVRT